MELNFHVFAFEKMLFFIIAVSTGNLVFFFKIRSAALVRLWRDDLDDQSDLAGWLTPGDHGRSVPSVSDAPVPVQADKQQAPAERAIKLARLGAARQRGAISRYLSGYQLPRA